MITKVKSEQENSLYDRERSYSCEALDEVEKTIKVGMCARISLIFVARSCTKKRKACFSGSKGRTWRN